jgi:hypothetical protein
MPRWRIPGSFVITIPPTRVALEQLADRQLTLLAQLALKDLDRRCPDRAARAASLVAQAGAPPTAGRPREASTL